MTQNQMVTQWIDTLQKYRLPMDVFDIILHACSFSKCITFFELITHRLVSLEEKKE